MTETRLRIRVVLLYGATGLVSFIAFALAMQLWRADLHVPFAYGNYGDTIEPQFKMLLDNAWFWNPSLAAPFGQDMRAMTELNTLKWAWAWVLVHVSHNAFIGQNLFEMFSPALSAMTFLYAVRRLGLSYAAGIPGAVLFGNLYFLYWRVLAGHVPQTNYWMVPLGCLAALQIARGEHFTVRRDWAIFFATAALIGFEDHYAAFFASFLAVVAIVIGCLQGQSAFPLRLGGAFVGVMALSFVVNDATPIVWTITHPGAFRYTYARYPVEAYLYSLSIAQLILPIPDHRIHQLATLRAVLDGVYPPLTTENVAATLGFFGTIGLCILLIALIARGAWGMPRMLEHAALLVLAAVVLATTGSIGAIVNTFITPDIRAYNRISTWIAFFCLFALAYTLDNLRRYLKNRGRTAAYSALAVVIAVLGVLDQSPAHGPAYAESRAAVAADRAWVERIAEMVPRNGAILQLPYVDDFSAPTTTIEEVPYFYSDSLRWSVGAFRGMQRSYFEKLIASLPANEMVAMAAARGFNGILVYRNQYPDHAAALEAALAEATGSTPVVNADGSQSFFSIHVPPRAFRAPR